MDYTGASRTDFNFFLISHSINHSFNVQFLTTRFRNSGRAATLVLANFKNTFNISFHSKQNHFFFATLNAGVKNYSLKKRKFCARVHYKPQQGENIATSRNLASYVRPSLHILNTSNLIY